MPRQGLGGWLILVGFNILASILGMIPLFGSFKPLFTLEWESIFRLADGSWDAAVLAITLVQFMVYTSITLTWLYVAFLFLTRKTAFPPWFISLHLFILFFTFFDAYMVNLVRPDIPVWDAVTTWHFIHNLVLCIVFIPYILRSRRVTATFRG